MRLTMVAISSNDLPLQFLLMNANILYSILFHLEVPGGKWLT